jgi:hypothetical protein
MCLSTNTKLECFVRLRWSFVACSWLHFLQQVLTQNSGRCLTSIVLKFQQISRDATIRGDTLN